MGLHTKVETAHAVGDGQAGIFRRTGTVSRAAEPHVGQQDGEAGRQPGLRLQFLVTDAA